MIPDGFTDLTSLVIKDWHWDDLSTEDAQVWDAFLYPIFLGATIRSAQAAYIKEVLYDLLDFENVHTILNDPVWSKKVIKVLNRQLNSVKGTAGEGLKKAILKVAIQKVESLDLSRTIGDAINFFRKQKIDATKIIQLQKDYQGTLALVYSAARDIYDFRYVKSILWLYGCGIGEDIVPPNAHVTSFLDECGYSGFGWSRNSTPDWQILTPACTCMKDVANQVSKEVGIPITPKQAQAAVWYLQACRGLLQSRHKRKFTPSKLVNFLDIQKWNIDDLSNRLDDVEQLDDLASALKTYYDSF